LILGARPIFRNLTWEVQHDQKIGLIGPNGAGKSSMLKLITGEFSPEPGGSVVRARGVTVGYLPQQPEFPPQQTAWQAAMLGVPRVAELENELHRVEESMGDPVVYGNEKALGRAIERQQTLMEEYQSLGGEQYPQRVRAMLLGLGLAEGEFDKPLEKLSGGQKKLVGLARLLLDSPQVLLLDEPDNHLDLDGKMYLERMIQAYQGAVVIISHDRYLLDAVVTHIAELEDGRISMFTGDYSAYIMDKEEKLARQATLYSIQQREISRIEAAIKRYSIWAKVYDNEKFAKRAQSIQKRLDKVDRMDKPVLERRKMDLRLNGWRGSNKVLDVRDVTKSFGEQVVLNKVNLLLEHGERVGMIGKNGTGKSVLLRLVTGREQVEQGEIILGPSIKVAYYAQEHEILDLEQSVLDTVRLAGNMSESNAVSLLNRYLFTYRQTGQKVKELSGGERSRLQLALIVLSGANFLLLDEPTNNLDIASAEVLEAALADFTGTVLVISHDRYFLDQVVNRILVLEDGRINTYPGGYSDYLAVRKN
ncbi:MAG: ABC-F family ATP-binding cassette domain-containing protein, partial [Anaerolineaceae bacterium]|nr:ABC-F family ATP-binding cassette domain-containing protein [Anaerolineaceae bacterium]